MLTTSVLRGGTNSHETTSEEANAVYTDFVSEGIVGSVSNTSGVAPATGGFAVNAQGTPDMTVAVSSGVAYVTGTPSSQNSQTFRVKNSASSNVIISANSSGSTKYDWLYLQLDATALNNPNTAGDDAASLVTSRSSSAATDDGTPPTYGYPLAVITVANGASSITNGNIRDIRTQVALNTGTSNASDGWNAITTSLTTATGYNKGNKEYDLTTGVSLVSVLNKGDRIKVTRGVTPPTQCTDLESGSSQYASKSSPSGITFTDDFTCEAWIKLESYTGAVQAILSRFNNTSGWLFFIETSGQLTLSGYNASGANFRRGTSYQSIPLGRWVHVAATLDMSGSASTIYIDGASVPVLFTQSGTNPAALIQAGDLEIGAYNGATGPFDGKIADVRLWNTIRTATQIRDNMNQQLVGNETNLVGYWKLDGNFNDSTSNANNLTGQNSAVATNVDNPMNATEYGIVTNVTASTVTVFTGTDYNIPNITLSTPYYSHQSSPYGFSSSKGKWKVLTMSRTQTVQSSPTQNTWYHLGNMAIAIPTGAWRLGYVVSAYGAKVGDVNIITTTSTSTSAESDIDMTSASNGNGQAGGNLRKDKVIELSTQTTYYQIMRTDIASVSNIQNLSVSPYGPSFLIAECAYA